VIVNVTGVPGQDPIVGVTVTVEEIEFEVEFVAVKAAMFPVPFAPNPVAVLLLLHVYVEPAVPEKVIAEVL
jgi:hypothetical protein